MSQTFETGDVVQLLSGGPKMTVRGIDPFDAHQIECQWFAGSKLSFGSFPVDSLKRVESDSSQES